MKLAFKAILASAIFLASPAVAQSNMSAKQWLEKMENGEDFAYIWMAGAIAGFGWANAKLEAEGNEEIFCPPKKLALNIEQARDILKGEIEENPEFADYPAGLMMLHALKTVFPCNSE